MATYTIGLGIGRGSQALHAVNRRTNAECGAFVMLASHWGEFQRGNPRLNYHGVCPTCAWAVALNQGTLSTELAAVSPTPAELAAWTRLLPQPGVFVSTCRAILAARESDNTRDPEHESWPQLLGHLGAHRPAVLVLEECAEHDCDHDSEAGCFAESTVVACAACSVRAGSWAGEWEGQYEVTVMAPCSVLVTMAARYPGPEWAGDAPQPAHLTR